MKVADNADHYARVHKDMEDACSFDQPLVVMNALATVVACYGLLSNSSAVVIGAMILAMLLGPISGAALALVEGDLALLRKASLAVGGGVAIVLATAIVIGFMHRDVPLTHQILERTSPNFFELMIALGGGAAGAYASISPRLSIAFVGVAIATALVPPLASCGLLLARGEFELAAGAFSLAFINIVAIQSAAAFVICASGIARGHWAKLLAPNLINVGILLVLFGALLINLRTLVGAALFEASITQGLRQELREYPGTFLADVRVSRGHEPDATLIRAVVRGPRELNAGDVGRLEDRLPRPSDGTPLQLRLRQIHTNVMTRNGPLFSAEDAGNGDR
ncbi:TIGR00341 family protein [Rhodoblastus sp.]|uniref:TIGR00341 family protein n=1 Tax=Rhodoblastus sp. TaxID=1962975 RepID=UPI003F9846AF